MRRFGAAAGALVVALTALVAAGVAPSARADTTNGLSVELREPSAANYYDTSFPYGQWSPLWQARISPTYATPPLPAISVQMTWTVVEVVPTDPKHLVPGVDLQMDLGHGWQEAPTTVTGVVPATATYASPFMFYFRFMPVSSQQQAIRLCANITYKAPGTGAATQTNNCTDDIVFTGTPPKNQPAASVPTSPTPTTPASSRTRTPTPSATSSPATPTPTPSPTPASSPTPDSASTPTTSDTPTPTPTPTPSTTAPTPVATASAVAEAKASGTSAKGTMVLTASAAGAVAIAAIGGAVFALRRRRGDAGTLRATSTDVPAQTAPPESDTAPPTGADSDSDSDSD
jgi:hypothetical protein